MTTPRRAHSGESAPPQPAVPRQEQRPGFTAQPPASEGGTYRARPGGPDTGEERFRPGVAAFSRLAWPVVLTAAVAALAVGILLLAWPKATLTVVAILLGASLVAAGLYRLFEGFAAPDVSGGTRAAYLITGLLAVAIGLFCLRHHDVTIFLLAFLVGAFWIIHGISDLAAAFIPGPGAIRALRALAGLFSIAAGIVVLFWPGISLLLLLYVLGAWLLLYGLMLLATAFRLMRASRMEPRAGHA
jgi:uncharacterized membrane protein HdeD (DUF308 family)